MDKVQFKNIKLTRNKTTILQNIEVTLQRDDFVLMTGQNGSGKSTFLKIIAGLIKPDSFNIYFPESRYDKFMFDKNRMNSWGAYKKFLRQHFCYLHQTPYLFSGTVYDNIAYGLKYRGLSRVEIAHRVDEALELIALKHLSQRSSEALSGGEKQRVAIARSWVTHPDFILLDEPFANMDKHSRQSTYEIINQLKEKNMGVIITSHDPHYGELNFNKQMHLYHGKISVKPYTHNNHSKQNGINNE